jgi:cytochrome c553
MRVPAMSLPTTCFIALLLSSVPVARAGVSDGHQDSGKEIYATCAACHGDLAQGGKRGEYPRLAGQRAAYLEYSLRKFRSRERINIPMLPYTQERELSDADIKAVSAYIAAIELPTQLPTFKPSDNAQTRLLAREKKVLIIPKLDGDLANGQKLYTEECAYCHGANGRGKTRFPMLVGQYTNYLQKQMDAYLKGERPHDAVEDDEEEEAKPKTAIKKVGVLNRLSEKDIKDILAYITRMQGE